MFEGKKKMAVAQAGIESLRENCDTVLVILNDKLREIYGNLAIRTAFSKADDILSTAARSIAEIITIHQDVNVDFEDVKTVMKDAGAAVMGSATEEGEGRAIRAAGSAISSPLLNNVDIKGAQKILLSIMSGEEEELSMDELSDITEYIQEKAGDNAEVIFGQGIDPELGRAIRVTVIATGFEMDRLANVPITTATSAPVSAFSTPVVPVPAPTPAPAPEQVKTVIDLDSGKSAQVIEEPMAEGTTFTFTFPKTPVAVEIPAIAEEEKEEVFSFEIQPVNETFLMEEPAEEEKIVHNLYQEQPVSAAPSAEPADSHEPTPPVFANDYYEQMKMKAIQRAHERFEKLKGGRALTTASDDLTEQMVVPAYQRKNVILNEPQHSSESTLSKFNLNEENEILGNNRFLHDNVD
jgi:cell division protein FtsZ